MKKATRFLLALILVVVAAFGVMACEDKTPDDNTDETTYKIEVTCDANQGTYKLDPNQDSYKSGDEVKLTVTPKSDYELDAVKIDGKTATANSNGSYTITVGEADVKVKITFKTKGDVPPAPSTYEVTVNCDEEKATVAFEEEGPYEEGEEVKFTVTPVDDNEIKSVKFNGTELKADKDDKYTITITKDKNVIDVEFETSEEPPVKTTYTVNLEYEEAQGSVTLSPSAQDNKYEEGAEVTINIEPNENYEIDTVKANDDEITKADGVYKFTVRGETTVKVTFKEKKVEPPVTDGPQGGLWTGDGTGTSTDPYIIKELNGTIKFRYTAPATKPWFKLQDFEYDTEYKIVSADPEDACYVRFYKNGSNVILASIASNDDNYSNTISFLKEGNNNEAENKYVVSEDDYLLFTIFNNNSLSEGDVTWVFEKVEKEPELDSDYVDYLGEWETNDDYMGTITLTVTKTDTGLQGVLESTRIGEMGTYNFVKNTEGIWSDALSHFSLSLNDDKTQLTLSDGTNTFELTKYTGVKIDSQCWGEWTWTSGETTHKVEIGERFIKIDNIDGTDITEFNPSGSMVMGYDFSWNGLECYLFIATPPQLTINEDMQNLTKADTSTDGEVSISEELQGKYTGKDHKSKVYTIIVEQSSITINGTQVTDLKVKTILLDRLVEGYSFKYDNYFCWIGIVDVQENQNIVQLLYEETEEMLEEEPYSITLSRESENDTISGYLGTWTTGDELDVSIKIEKGSDSTSLKITITEPDEEEGDIIMGPYTATYDGEEDAYVFDMDMGSGKIKLSEGKLIYSVNIDGNDQDPVELQKSAN